MTKSTDYVALTKLMWLFAKIAAILGVLFAIGEWATPRVAATIETGWAVTAWVYAVRFIFGFALISTFIALLMAQRRSMLR